jgi:hypothetical protein
LKFGTLHQNTTRHYSHTHSTSNWPTIAASLFPGGKRAMILGNLNGSIRSPHRHASESVISMQDLSVSTFCYESCQLQA